MSSIKSLPTPAPGDVWYYAFGSNMNPTVLTGRRRVHPKASVPATLEGYTMGFNYRSMPYVEPGMATVFRVSCSDQAMAKQQLAALPRGPDGKPQILTSQAANWARMAAGLHGVAHLITADEWEQVKATEGVKLQGIGYQVVRVTLDAYNGAGKIDAYTLVAAPLSSVDPGKVLPSKRYMDLIREGARISGIEPSYCDMLESHPVFEPSNDWRQYIGRTAMAGIALGIAVPLMPVIFASAAVSSVKDWWWGQPTAVHAAAAPGATSNTLPPEQPTQVQVTAGPEPTPSLIISSALNPTSTAASTAITTKDLGAQSMANTKPPPGASFIMWMRQYVDTRFVAGFMFSATLLCNVAHDWLLEPILGSGLSNNSVVAKQQRQMKKLK